MGLLPILGLCTLNCGQLGDSWRQVCHEMKTKQSDSNQSRSSNSQRFRNMDATIKCLRLGKGDGMTHFTIVILFLIKWLGASFFVLLVFLFIKYILSRNF